MKPKAIHIRGLLYIDQHRIYFFRQDTGLQALDIPQDIERDMEVLNREKLTVLIHTFLQTHKVAPGQLTIVLADTMVFPKSLAANSDQKNRQDMVDQFLSNVPFNKVVHTEISSSSSIIVLAANEEMCLAFAKVFEGEGHTVEFCVPATVFTQIKPSPQGIDMPTAQMYLQHIDENKQYNLLKQYMAGVVQLEHRKEHFAAKKVEAKRLPLLIAVFGWLIIILFIVIFVTRATNPEPTSRSVNADDKKPATLPTLPAAKNANAFDRTSVKIQIIAAPDVLERAESARAAILQKGYVNVELAPASTSAQFTTVVLKQSLPQSLKDTLLSEIKSLTNSSTATEAADLQFDASVVFGAQ